MRERLAGLLALGGARLLPVGQLLDGGGADAELDEVQRHGLLPNERDGTKMDRRRRAAASANGCGIHSLPALLRRARARVLRDDRLAEHAEVARVHGRIGAAGRRPCRRWSSD